VSLPSLSARRTEGSESLSWERAHPRAISPDAAAEIIFDGVRQQQLYIYTHPKQAEELVQKLAESAEPLMDDEKLLELSSKEIQAASEAAIKAEQACTLKLAEARARRWSTTKQAAGT